jgi:uncharacterized membrane protein YqjE
MATSASRAADPVPPAAFSAAPETLIGAAPRSATGVDMDSGEASFLAPFERVFATVKRIASNYATLAVLDIRRAAVQLAWLIAGGIFISVLVVTAWLAGVMALCVWLLGDVLTWPGVLAVAAVLNLVGAGIVGLRLKAIFAHVPFEATLRQIKPEDEKDKQARSEAGAAA